MKMIVKCILSLLLLLIILPCYSQILYNETFDSFTVGNVGTDFTGKISGQGGWYTFSDENTQANSLFTIVNEAGRGKIFDITSPISSRENLIAFKTNLKPLIENRTTGYDVLKFEIDYYTGSKQPSTPVDYSRICLLGVGDFFNPPYPESLAEFHFNKDSGSIKGYSRGNTGDIFTDGLIDFFYLPFNNWVKINIYLDYANRKAYFDLPYLKRVFVGDFLKNSSSNNLLKDHTPDIVFLGVGLGQYSNWSNSYTRNRYDNIKISALNAVPPEVIALSSREQLATKFNLYPNPATNVVNITNNENMLVQQVTVYDIAGKQLSTQNFSNETEIQLNVENLASGTYMLHLQTTEGTAVKKLVKN